MARTSRQVAADEALTAAVQEVIEAYRPPDLDEDDLLEIPEGYVLGDYLVVLAAQGIDSDGDLDVRTATLVRDGNLAPYRAAGLLVTANDNL